MINYYRINLEIGKKKNIQRTVFTQQKDILGALSVSNKAKKGGRLISIVPISKEEYLSGISRKYSSNK